jgi:hypothetical protein
MRLDVRVVWSNRAVVTALGVPALAALVSCGGGSSSPTGNPTPVATTTPAPTPTPTPDSPGLCNPTPPPLYGIHMKIHDDSGFRKILDSRPQVINVGSNPSYCEQVGQGNGAFCFPRMEGGDLQMFACDSLAMGRSPETGRWGPTWYYNGKPCAAEGENVVGCKNHPDNQFLVIAKGPGEYAACANANVPVAGDRCGTLVVR